MLHLLHSTSLAIGILLAFAASWWSAHHDNHPAATMPLGYMPLWARLNPLLPWTTKRGILPDPLNVLLAFAAVLLWANVIVALLVTAAAFAYARWVEPMHAVVAPPWEPEDGRDAAIGAVLALLLHGMFG